jgi:hypothetical protein
VDAVELFLIVVFQINIGVLNTIQTGNQNETITIHRLLNSHHLKNICMTLVKFRYNDANRDLFAVFPQIKFNKRIYGNSLLSCYSHIGQHSSCHEEYVKKCRPAKPEEHADLLRELQSIGYKLKVCK